MTDTLIFNDPTGPKAQAKNTKAARPGRKSTRNLKLLLSTAALAATLDGWALLAAKGQSAGTGVAVPVAEIPAGTLTGPADGAVSGSYLPALPPIPTVVPAPTISSAGTWLAPGGGHLAAPASQVAPPAALVAPAPVPLKATRPALRKVSPPPVAVSRSSR